MNTNEAPEGMAEEVIPSTDAALNEGAEQTEPAREPTPEELQAAAEEAQRQAQAERDALVARARARDPLTFLARGTIVDHHNGFFSRGALFFINEEVSLVKYRAIANYTNVHIAGQVLLNAVAQRTIFTIEDFQKAFNNVSIITTDGATEEKQDLLTKTAMAITKQAWASAERYRRLLPAHLDRFTIENAEQLRIPATMENGAVFNGGVDLLFEPSAGRFQQTGGIVLRYTHPENDDGQNHYVVLLRDVNPEDQEDAAAVQFYLRDILMARNMEIERFVSADVDVILSDIVAEVGEAILKQDAPATEAANDADGNASTTDEVTDA